MPGSGKIAFTVQDQWGERLSFYLKGSDRLRCLGEYYKCMKDISEDVYSILHVGNRCCLDWSVHKCGIEEGSELSLIIRRLGD